MKDETSRREFLRMVASYQDRGDPTGWFDKVYRDAQGDIRAIVWADLVPNPHLVSWLEEHPVADQGQRAVIVGCGVGDVRGKPRFPVPRYIFPSRLSPHARSTQTKPGFGGFYCGNGGDPPQEKSWQSSTHS